MISGNLVFDTGKSYPSDFRPGFVELSAIGSVACNNKWFDVGIQWLQHAFKVRQGFYIQRINKILDHYFVEIR